MNPEITELLGYKRYNYPLIDSTNLQAKELLDKFVSLPFIVTADVQNSGRGRQGRSWVSDVGNLFLSIVVAPRKDIKPEIYSYIIALSFSEALRELSIDSSIKWPNDVLVKGKKICGILLEGHKEKLIIGIGVNVNSYPEYLQNIDATSILKEGSEISKEDLLVLIVKKFKEYSLKDLQEIILMTDAKLQKEKEYRTSNGDKGKIEGISKDGDLILNCDGERKHINYGEIFEL